MDTWSTVTTVRRVSAWRTTWPSSWSAPTSVRDIGPASTSVRTVMKLDPADVIPVYVVMGPSSNKAVLLWAVLCSVTSLDTWEPLTVVQRANAEVNVTHRPAPVVVPWDSSTPRIPTAATSATALPVPFSVANSSVRTTGTNMTQLPVVDSVSVASLVGPAPSWTVTWDVLTDIR